MDLIRELGWRDEVIGSNDHLRVTYVRKGGRLVPLPDGLMMMVPTKILPLVDHAAAELAHQDPHGPGTAAAAQDARRRRIGGASSCASTTGRKRWTTWPSRCSRASTAAIREKLSVTSVLPRFVELAAQVRQPDPRRAGLARAGSEAQRPPAAAVPHPERRLGQLVDARRRRASAAHVDGAPRRAPRRSSARPPDSACA